MNNFIIVFSASLIAGALGAMGLGGGSVLILYLTLFCNTPQLTAQGINLIFFLPTALIATIIYSVKKEIKFKTVSYIVLGGIPSTVLFGYLAGFVKTEILSKIFGGLVLIFGIWQIFKKEK